MGFARDTPIDPNKCANNPSFNGIGEIGIDARAPNDACDETGFELAKK